MAVLGLLKSKSPTLLGIDVSSACVKILELSSHDGHYCVENYVKAPFPNADSGEQSTTNPSKISQVVSQALVTIKPSTRLAAIAVPSSSVITKILQLDGSLSELELETQVIESAEKYIPYPLEEVSLDFYVIKENGRNTHMVDVLVVASKTEKVDEYVGYVESAGLDVKIVDVDAYAAERTCKQMQDQLPNQGRNQTIALIDIGAYTTNLIVLNNLTAIFTRDDLFGGEHLTRDVQNRYGLSYSEAEVAKKTGGLPDDYGDEILQPFMESCVIQVKRALQFYYSASQQHEISHLLLSGGTVVIPGLLEKVAENVGIPASIANPFSQMSVHERVNNAAILNDASSLLVATGLAMRGLSDDRY